MQGEQEEGGKEKRRKGGLPATDPCGDIEKRFGVVCVMCDIGMTAVEARCGPTKSGRSACHQQQSSRCNERNLM